MTREGYSGRFRTVRGGGSRELTMEEAAWEAVWKAVWEAQLPARRRAWVKRGLDYAARQKDTLGDTETDEPQEEPQS